MGLLDKFLNKSKDSINKFLYGKNGKPAEKEGVENLDKNQVSQNSNNAVCASNGLQNKEENKKTENLNHIKASYSSNNAVGTLDMSQSKVEEAKIKEEDNRPKGKELEWFYSEKGLETLKEYTEPKCFLKQDAIMKETQEKGVYLLSHLESYQEVYKIKLPYVYFYYFSRALVNAGKAEGYSTRDEYFLKYLCNLSSPVTYDDIGEPKKVNPIISGKDIIDVDKNPLLKFGVRFQYFDILGDDDVGTTSDKIWLYENAVYLVYEMTRKNINFLSENSWLLDKDTYFSDFGTVINPIVFFKKCKEKGVDSSFCDKCINELKDSLDKK